MYVDVALPRSAPEPLTYHVPEALAAWVQVGSRVRVPIRSRHATGLVVGIAATCEIPADRVRDVAEVVDEHPALPAHLLELADFVAGYYRCPLGDTLASMLPAGLLRADAESVEVTTEGVTAAGADLPPTQAAVLEVVREGGKMRVPTALSRAGATSRASLEALAEAGLVNLRRRRRDRPATLEVAAYALADRSADELLQACVRAPRRRQVVEWLLAEGRPALAREIEAAVGCSAATLRAMATAGILHKFTQRPAGRSRWSLRSGGDPVTPTAEQETAVAAVVAAIQAQEFAPILLDGVTGSGKTEVYLRSLSATLDAGRGGLVLVPEIGLTPAASGAVERRFGDKVAVLHSAQSESERWREWCRARDGEARIVIGPRSALFAPVQRPGLIVVDEEHDAAYKQQESPRYHARDLALVLGQRLGVPVVMCSATPSAEAAALVRRERATRLVLSQRVAGGKLPTVELVDLRSEPADPGEHGRTLVSEPLRDALGETLAAGDQAILLMQRRGWAPMIQCRECGHRLECPECSVSLVVHRRSRDLRCHYCGHRRGMPRSCPSCSGELMEPIGAGTEKVAARMAELFPEATTAILDRDTVRRRGGLEATLGAFAAGRVQVLVGTQMVAKGHHFPGVTLTGVISADAMLGLPDFRSGERTFQLLTQVAGRAGRGSRPGRVLIQTYHPDHPAVRHACNHDTRAFLAEELVFRQAFHYPPASRMALVRYEGRSESAVRTAAEAGAAAVSDLPPGCRLRGPAPAPLERIRGAWRWQVLLTTPAREPLRQLLARVEQAVVPGKVRRVVDVDPLSTL